MKIFLLIIFFLPSISVEANSTIEEFKTKITNLDLTKIKAVDLCTKDKVELSKLQFVKVWSINCANCLWEFEDLGSKLDQRYTLINVDTKTIDRKMACRWVEKHNLKALSINDSGSIKELIGENYPLPISFTVKDNSSTDIQFGYWRKQ